MTLVSRVAVGFLAAMSLACGLLGTAMSMNPSTTPATDANYNQLKAAAEQRGWRAQRGDANDWDLQVFPAEGEKIILTESMNSHNIQYMCEGGRFDQDDDLCAREVDALCKAAFGESCEDF